MAIIKTDGSLKKPKLGKFLLLAVWSVLYAAGLIQYPGSAWCYTLFSAIYLTILASAFVRQVSYGYMFLAVMIWLGFWLKLTVHLWIGYSYVEPVGYFKSSPASWDQVLLVASVGGIGLLVGRIIYSLFRQRSTMTALHENRLPPAWYLPIRRYLWLSLLAACLLIAVVNALYGIGQAGLVPRTILFWPLNALVYWLLSYGFALAVATLLWWDVSLGKKLSWVVYAVLLEGLLSAISLLSRATYVFHAVPQLLALLKNRASNIVLTKKQIFVLVVMFIVFLMGSLRGVNALRGYYYSGEPIRLYEDVRELSQVKASILRTSQFLVDRWVGLEGVMAVSDYPSKNPELFYRQLTERPEVGKSSIYQEICLANYRFMDLSKYQFSSLPGPIAFLYSSGLLWMAFFGMLLLTLLVLSSERLIYGMTRNPILAALWGGMTANLVAQMGVAPIGLLKFILLMLAGVATITFIQSDWFARRLSGISRLCLSKANG